MSRGTYIGLRQKLVTGTRIVDFRRPFLFQRLALQEHVPRSHALPPLYCRRYSDAAKFWGLDAEDLAHPPDEGVEIFRSSLVPALSWTDLINSFQFVQQNSLDAGVVYWTSCSPRLTPAFDPKRILSHADLCGHASAAITLLLDHRGLARPSYMNVIIFGPVK